MRAFKSALILLVMGCAAGGPQPDTGHSMTVVESSSVSAFGPAAGSVPVGAIPNAVLHDSQRNKDVEMVIEYPTQGGPHPIIVFSHGYGASQNGYVGLTEYWTTNGYVCIKPAHADAGALAAALTRDTAPEPEKKGSSKENRLEQRHERIEAIREVTADIENVWKNQTESDWRNRARDITLIIDSLDTLEEKYPELRGRMDHTRIGVGGHSYGAFTTMELSGMRCSQGDRSLNLADRRVKAGIALSPQGIGMVPGLTAGSWHDVTIPMLYMTGTLDRTPGGEGVERRHDAFANTPNGDKYFVSIEGARHRSFTGMFGITPDEMRRGNTSTGLPPGTYPRDPRDPSYDPNQQQMQTARPSGNGSDYLRERNIFGTVKVTTLSFWNAFLKNETKGKEFLTSAGLKQRVGTKGSVEAK